MRQPHTPIQTKSEYHPPPPNCFITIHKGGGGEKETEVYISKYEMYAGLHTKRNKLLFGWHGPFKANKFPNLKPVE